NHPVVAANFFGTVAEINCCGLIQSRQRICACTIFGNQLVRREPNRFAKSVIEAQDFTREQRGIYRRITIQSRIAGLKTLELLYPQDLRHSPGGLPPPNFKWKEAIARHVVTLRKKQIVLVLCIDMRNAPTVRENLYRLTQAGKLDRLVVRRDRGSRPRRCLG